MAFMKKFSVILIFFLSTFSVSGDTKRLYFAFTCSDMEYEYLLNDYTGQIMDMFSQNGIECIFPEFPRNLLDREKIIKEAYEKGIHAILFSQISIDGENLIIESELSNSMNSETLKKVTSGGKLNLGAESKWSYIISKVIPVIKKIDRFPSDIYEELVKADTEKTDESIAEPVTGKTTDSSKETDSQMIDKNEKEVFQETDSGDKTEKVSESTDENSIEVVQKEVVLETTENTGNSQIPGASSNESIGIDTVNKTKNSEVISEIGFELPTGYNLNYLPGKYISNGISQYISIYGDTLFNAGNSFKFGPYYGIGYFFSFNAVKDYSYIGDITLQSHYITAQLGLRFLFSSNWFVEFGTVPEWIFLSYYTDAEGSESLPITDFPIKFPIQLSSGYEYILKNKIKYQLGIGIKYKPVDSSVFLFELLLVQRLKF